MTNKKRFLIGLFSVFALATLFTLHAFGQSPPLPDGINPVTAATNAPSVATPAVTAQNTGVALAMTLIPVIVPLLIALSKFILPKLPSWTLPIIAPILGEILNLISTKTGVGGVGPINAALLGAAGVGVREVYDQVQYRAKNGPALATVSAIMIFFGVSIVGLATGCGTHSLQNGGAYAPGTNAITIDATSGITSTNFVATAAPDLAFFQVESAFDFAYSTIDAVFTIEHDNRLLLWKISPDIKHTLDKLRPEAVTIRNDYIKARIAYQANPVPANLSQLQTILARIQSTAAAVQAAIPASATTPAK